MPRLFQKDQIPWNKGLKMSDEMKYRISETLKRKGIKPIERFVGYGEKNPNWKGDNASYSAKHYWVVRKLGQPKLCKFCGTTIAKKFEWANISREYKRDITDYIRLCCQCHKKYDNTGQRSAFTRMQRYK